MAPRTSKDIKKSISYALGHLFALGLSVFLLFKISVRLEVSGWTPLLTIGYILTVTGWFYCLHWLANWIFLRKFDYD